MLQDFLFSLWNYREYPTFLKRKKRHVFLYGAFLTLLFWMLTVLVPAVGWRLRTGGLRSYIQANLPDFHLSVADGRLQTDQSFHYADGRLYVDINTADSNRIELDSPEMRTRLALNDVVLAADAERIIYKANAGNAIGSGDVQMLEFSQVEDFTLSRDDIMKMIPMIRTLLCAMAIFSYLIELLGFFLWLLMVAAFGRLLAHMMGTRLGYGQIYKLSAYTRSVPVILQGFLALFGFVFPEYAALSLLYSLFVLSRVFRYMAVSGTAVLLSEDEQIRDGEPAEPRGDADAGSQEKTQSREAGKAEENGLTTESSRTAESGQITEDRETTENSPAEESSRVVESQQNDIGASGARAAENRGEKLRPSDAAGWIVPGALNNRDIRPSDGWSFGSFAASASETGKTKGAETVGRETPEEAGRAETEAENKAGTE